MLEIYCDGEEGGIGFVIYNDGIKKISGYQYIGKNITNVQAEFTAAINSLCFALEYFPFNEAILYTSVLVIDSISGVVNIKEASLIPFYELLIKIITLFKSVELKQNKNFDVLALSEMARNLKKSKVIQHGQIL